MPNIIQHLKDAYIANPASTLKMLPELFQAAGDGKIVELPCKVGDTVFANIDGHTGDFLDECVISRIEYSKDYSEPLFTAICTEKAEYQTYWASDFGKEIFLEAPVPPVKPRKKVRKHIATEQGK